MSNVLSVLLSLLIWVLATYGFITVVKVIVNRLRERNENNSSDNNESNNEQ